jgi:gluconokinase
MSGGGGAPAGTGRLLVVDAGSSSVKATYVGVDGRLDPDPPVRISYGWRTDGGAMEMPASELTGAVEQAIDAVLGRSPTGGPLRGVALTAFWHSLVGVDADGAPVTPIYGWAEGRSREAADRLRARMDEADYHRRTGCYLHPAYPATRLLWLREEHPEVWSAARSWWSGGELLLHHLTGTSAASLSMASGSGLLDLASADWDPETLAAVEIEPTALPPLASYASAVPLPRLRRRWPELAGVPCFPVEGDGACAAIGSDLGDAGWSLTLGTSAALRAVVAADAPPVTPGLWCYRIDGERYLVGGALSNAGAALSWLRRTLRLPDDEALAAVVGDRLPGEHAISVTPTFLDERPPRQDRGGASFRGVRPSTTPADLFHATLEAVTHRIAGIAETMAEVLPEPPFLAANGGALRSFPAWGQLVADALGTPVRPGHPESTARGVAALVWARLGETMAPAEPGPDTLPRPRHTDLHRALRGGAE